MIEEQFKNKKVGDYVYCIVYWDTSGREISKYKIKKIRKKSLQLFYGCDGGWRMTLNEFLKQETWWLNLADGLKEKLRLHEVKLREISDAYDNYNIISKEIKYLKNKITKIDDEAQI